MIMVPLRFWHLLLLSLRLGFIMVVYKKNIILIYFVP